MIHCRRLALCGSACDCVCPGALTTMVYSTTCSESLLLFEMLFMVPVCLLGAVAVYRGDNTIRNWLLVYGAVMSYSMIPELAEELWGALGSVEREIASGLLLLICRPHASA